MNKQDKIKLINFIYDSIDINYDNKPFDFDMCLLSNGTIYFNLENEQICLSLKNNINFNKLKKENK